MRYSIVLTVILLAVQGTVLTVDGFDIFNLLSKPIDKFLQGQKNKEKEVDGLKKDNDFLRRENEALNATNIELSDSLEKEQGARELAEKALEEEQNLVESCKQAIDELQQQLDEAQQQLETSNQQREDCRSENEVLRANMEQLNYSLSVEIQKLREENADYEQALSSWRFGTSDFISRTTVKQSQLIELIASLQRAASENSAIVASYVGFAATHNLTIGSVGSES
ncbi:puff II/9-2 protein-like [Bradysia coprophila]|uniref:puff II/9-2 protein-like n=1 Tax=Bradysia coprophila TaxID=38358 RepID=UPI00187DCC71|nr:puff II/9-2 protein-like [Bradysia coprophila]XP_037037360.1 puff II/9-2 protein-like [Bradysia coprophila]